MLEDGHQVNANALSRVNFIMSPSDLLTKDEISSILCIFDLFVPNLFRLISLQS